MQCHVHPERAAVATCTACGRAVCQECAVNVAGQIRCKGCVTAASAPDRYSGPLFTMDARLKEPSFAAMLSIVHGGFGQYYNGEIAKGVMLFGAKMLVLILAIVFFFVFWPIGIVLVLGWLALWVFGIVDAYVSCQKLNERIMKRGPQTGPAYSDGLTETR